MKKIPSIVFIIPIFLLLFLLFTLLIHNGNLTLLNPHGYIAQIQSRILLGALTLIACIGICSIGVTFFIAFRYKEKPNRKVKYSPEWTGSRWLILLWWILPTLLVLVVSTVVWQTAHEVDPYKAIPSNVKPISVQVVALRWKWLFIYPSEKIATVNFLEFPVNAPINFQLTADAPMSSFWIPNLGGQIYAMNGMSTQLHLMATTLGDFPGSAAEINGEGFSGMKFIARSTTQSDYATWIASVKKSGKLLNMASYQVLANPSINNPITVYQLTDTHLYNEIMEQFMQPTGSQTHMSGM